jgi:hypothetical protein
MWMTVISTTAAMFMAVRWRHSPMISAEHWRSTSHLGFGQPRSSRRRLFRACVPGRLTGVAVPVHVGRRTIVLQTSIYRADGKLAAMMIQTQMVLPRGSTTYAGEGSDEV